MIRYGASVFIAVAAFCSFSFDASAHVTLTDGQMEVFSHIDPDDDPIARDPGGFFLVFEDKAGKFDPTLCECTIAVRRGDKVIWDEVLFETLDPDNATTTSVEYSFPKKGVYDVEIKGSPKVAGAFAAFEVHRIVRVERESATNGPTNYLHYSIFGVVFLIIVGLFVLESKKKRKAEKGSAKASVIIALSAFLLLALLYHEANATSHLDDHAKTDHPCCAMQAVNVVFYEPGPKSDEKVSHFISLNRDVPYTRASVLRVRNNSPPF